jgi:hypothetical protein
MSGTRFLSRGHLCCACLVGGLSSIALAGQRTVLFEEFTATWCVPCKPVGTAIGEMIDAGTPYFAPIQIHTEDAYESAWGYARRCFYGYCDPAYAFPTVYVDGILKYLGTMSKATYESALATRAAVPTDVKIDLWAELVAGTAYTVAARVSLEPGATGSKSMRVHITQILDKYPKLDHYPADGVLDKDYRDCYIQSNPSVDITLAPGESQDIVTTFAFTGPSWTYKEDMKLVAWAQQVKATWPAEVYQSAIVHWPFPSSAPGVPGDLDGDGHVNQVDLGILLADYGCTDGVGMCPGDCDGDGDVDQQDLGILLGAYGT